MLQCACVCLEQWGGFEGPLNWHLVHSGNRGNKGVEGKRGEKAAGGDGGRKETKDKSERKWHCQRKGLGSFA